MYFYASGNPCEPTEVAHSDRAANSSITGSTGESVKISCDAGYSAQVQADSCFNGIDEYYPCDSSMSDQDTAIAACEAHYGDGTCITASCGAYSYAYYSSHSHCTCSKPLDSYEFVYSNNGGTTVGDNYGGAYTDVTGNTMFVRQKGSTTCNSYSWSLVYSTLGDDRTGVQAASANATCGSDGTFNIITCTGLTNELKKNSVHLFCDVI